MPSNSIKKIGKFFLVLFLILTGIWFYRQNEEKKRLRKEQEEKLAREKERERKRLYDFFKSKISHIYQANSKIARYIDFKTGYFTNYHLTSWQGFYKTLFIEITD